MICISLIWIRRTYLCSKSGCGSGSPRNERIQLDLFYTAQRIKECVIYWNVRQNSLVKELPASGVNGKIPVLLEDMPEGTYSFEIVTKDLYGNESLVVEAVENLTETVINPV